MKVFRIVAPIVFIVGLLAIYIFGGFDQESPNTVQPQQYQMPTPSKDYDFKR